MNIKSEPIAKLADIKWVNEMNECHKGEWLTMEIMEEYVKKASKLPTLNGELVKERRKLCLELMEKYGVSEIDATNIVMGYARYDYVNKYYRIRNKIPIKRINREMKKDDES